MWLFVSSQDIDERMINVHELIIIKDNIDKIPS